MKFPGCPLHYDGLQQDCVQCEELRESLVSKFTELFYDMSPITLCFDGTNERVDDLW